MADGAGNTASRHVDADRLAELEEERRFLLRSLADLERERAVGDVDEADFAALRDGYTSRAAAVLRSIDDGRSAMSVKPPRRVARIIGMSLAVVVIGAVLGVLVARFAAPRGSGDTITGGTDSDRISALLTQGRTAMGQFDYSAATDSYTEVLDIESDNLEARTYLGWVLANAAQQLVGDAKATTLAAGTRGLTDAVATDPTYADPYCFLAIIAAQFDGDLATATARQQQCLEHDPSADMQQLMAELVAPVIATAGG